MSLRSRLAVFIALTTLIAVLVQGTLGYLSFQHQVYSSLDRDLNIYVQQWSRMIRRSSMDERGLRELNKTYEGYVTRVRIVHEGVVLRSFGDFPPEIPLPTLDQAPTTYGQWRVVTWPGPIDDEGQIDFFVQGAISSRELSSSLTSYQQTMVLTTLLVTLVGAVLALLLSRPALRPLQHLLDTTRKVAHSGDLSLRVPQDGQGELRELSETFNEMLDRLSAYRTRETEFTRNASHELRTPLTAMKLHLGSWKAGYANPEETLGTIEEEVERMARLSESLLTLAREGRSHKVHFDVAELARETATSRKVLWSGPEEHILCGDPLLIRQALLNLLTNAEHHAPQAEVQVSLRKETLQEQEFAVLQVKDSGPGLSDEALSRATETFYRAPGTRTPGSGLGLSVVAQVAAVHEGEVKLFRNEPQGLVVEVWLKNPAN
ncbi:sensor histidine kinase [Deinococcus misasensis]|uniref:sensor histidine kinase n=1 Tax=Deinococcus misasensis TaxID=392413 RepID=UPI000558C5BE|nr:HAMP domain-containing sensor histidine kinase [Deinococcus misasensis]